MKTLYKISVISILYGTVFCASSNFSSDYNLTGFNELPPSQVTLNANNIASWIWSNGVFNQRVNVQPGFEWPRGAGRYAIFTSGLCIGGYVNNQLRLAAAFYGEGEYSPGYCVNGVFNTNTTFKLYRVSRGNNYMNNPDWLNWGLMVPFGAPYNDVNNSGYYEYAIDTPGVKGAAQTIFLCMTDADNSLHNMTFPFYGSTAPLGAEIHLTAWCYDNAGYGDMQFLKWVILNKNTSAWDSTLFSILCETDLGDPNDDYIGCDTTRNLGYCYNADNQDGNGGMPTYGANPPAVGIRFLNCNTSNPGMTVFGYFTPCTCPPPCESYPQNSFQSYNFMKGIKRDGTPFVIPFTNPPQTSKFLYSGDPETGAGWTEYTGRIFNCGGSLTGTLESPAMPWDMRFIMSTRPANPTMNPGDTAVVQIVQMIGRGSNHKNSVTILKQVSDTAYQLCQNGFVIGINPISTEIPEKFSLYQNYPNPFNPVTKIRFQIPLLRGVDVSGGRGVSVNLTIYDALGREISTLVNEKLNPGTYSVDWDGTNYPSGVYFYKLVVSGATPLQADSYTETKKMVFIK